MPVDFSLARWDHIRDTYRRYWAGALDRPIIAMTLTGYDPGRPEPTLPYEGFTSRYDMSVPAERIVNRWDWNLSCQRYLGDAFPHMWPNFGAGAVAAFAGAHLNAAPETTWFHPEREYRIDELDFRFDPENVWFRRVADLMRAATDRWQGVVQVDMTDLGGTLDVLSTFRPGVELFYDMADHSDEVKRQTWAIHDLWWAVFEELNTILQPVNPGYTGWTPIFSEVPYYVLQCDFSYMVGTKHFDEFIKPELAACCRRLGNSCYHLDGPGQLSFLDSLLEIPELKCIQWVPGTGNPGPEAWPEVYKKIRDAGKLIQLIGSDAVPGWKIVDVIAEKLGTAKGINYFGWADRSREDEVRAMLERWGAL